MDAHFLTQMLFRDAIGGDRDAFQRDYDIVRPSLHTLVEGAVLISDLVKHHRRPTDPIYVAHKLSSTDVMLAERVGFQVEERVREHVLTPVNFPATLDVASAEAWHARDMASYRVNGDWDVMQCCLANVQMMWRHALRCDHSAPSIELRLDDALSAADADDMNLELSGYMYRQRMAVRAGRSSAIVLNDGDPPYPAPARNPSPVELPTGQAGRCRNAANPFHQCTAFCFDRDDAATSTASDAMRKRPRATDDWSSAPRRSLSTKTLTFACADLGLPRGCRKDMIARVASYPPCDYYDVYTKSTLQDMCVDLQIPHSGNKREIAQRLLCLDA